MADGILDGMLAPLGQQLVDPNGQVSAMLDPAEAERKRKAEEAAALAALQQKSVMEAAAATPAAKPKQLSSWNPFVLLFGDPTKSDSSGLLN